LADLVRFANSMNLTARAVRLDLDELANLRVPCILHWDLNHFVVLHEVHRNHIMIMNPASGWQKVRMEEVSRCFTGVALELFPNTQFEEKHETRKIRVLPMLRGVVGLKRSETFAKFLSLPTAETQTQVFGCFQLFSPQIPP